MLSDTRMVIASGRESGINMPQVTDYRKRAEECVTLAQTVRTPEQRTMLLHIAETWLRLADDATAKAVPFDVLTQLSSGSAN